MTEKTEDLIAEMRERAEHPATGSNVAQCLREGAQALEEANARLAALTTGQEIDPPSVREAIGEVLADMEAVIDGVPVASDLVALQEITDAAIQAATSAPSRTAKRTGYETVSSAGCEHSQKITARAALTAPQEAKSVAKVVPVSYEASASCSHGVCPTGCSHLMWECTVCSCEGGWGVAMERLEELAAKHVCVAAAPTPQEGDARERLRRGVARGAFEDFADYPLDGEIALVERVADAILAAFPVLSRAAAPEEPEWEYGLRTRSRSHPERGFFSYAGDPETARAMYEATREDCDGIIVRRRKTGPWLPVGGETDGE